MNKKLKRGLKNLFTPPPPAGKKAFLKRFPYPRLSFGEFFLHQVGYIRKRVWLVWGLCFGTLLLILPTELWRFFPTFWVISALLPFLALLMVTELARSASCRMAELESACRYSLQHILLVRAAVLGSVNLLTLTAAAAFLARQPEAYGFLRLGLYLLTPYLLSCCGSLFVLNRFPGPESLYACGGVCGGVSLCCVLLSSPTKGVAYSAESLPVWGILLLACILATGIQVVKFIKKTAEPIGIQPNP